MLFKPTAAFRTILDITPDVLRKMQVKALILDLDNTLTTHNNPEPAEGVTEWIETMRTNGVKLLILSNNSAERVKPFADMLKLGFIPDGAKPLSVGYKKAVKELGVKRKYICGVGDQIFTDILGANITGIKSIFTVPIESENSIFFKIKRTAEKPFLPKKFGG